MGDEDQEGPGGRKRRGEEEEEEGWARPQVDSGGSDGSMEVQTRDEDDGDDDEGPVLSLYFG